jgi:lysyl-tRNA synthetase class II
MKLTNLQKQRQEKGEHFNNAFNHNIDMNNTVSIECFLDNSNSYEEGEFNKKIRGRVMMIRKNGKNEFYLIKRSNRNN